MIGKCDLHFIARIEMDHFAGGAHRMSDHLGQFVHRIRFIGPDIKDLVPSGGVFDRLGR